VDEGRAYVYYGSAAGLSPTPNWTAESDQAGAEFSISAGTAGDINGDGYSDVVVGARYYSNGQTEEGRAWVYHGSAAGLSPIPNWTAESNQAGAMFGRSAGTAGDVNGDGYSDVVVGAYRYSNGQAEEGRAYVYYGSAAGLSPTAGWTAESDQAGAYFGFSLGTAGDVNGDGYSDVVVGATYYDNGQTDEGRAYVYDGSAAGLSPTASWTAESNQASTYFGSSVGSAGDVNGDGYADIIVGAPAYDNGQADEGRAYVYYGSAAGLPPTPNWTAESDQAGAYFGNSVSTAGDVNGDGYTDVIVGAPYYDNGQTDEGRAYVYHGSAAGLSSLSNWTAESDQAGAWFGVFVATAGDVNGDGYADVIVTADRYDNGQTDEGRAYVFHGSAAGLSTTPDWTAEGNQAGAEFGNVANTAGDVNGDGYADIIVGAKYYDNGQTDEGAIFVYYGSPAGLSPTPNWTAESDQTGAEFGVWADTAGDVNGDGYSDVIVGARYYDNGQTDEGRAYAYYGSAGGLSLTPDWIVESNQSGALFGDTVGTAGDVNGDGFSDVIVGAYRYDNGQTDEGRAYVYHGSAAGLSTTPNWTVESNQGGSEFGRPVGTAGDVNGDGYSDVFVGAYLYSNDQANEGAVFVYYGSAGGLSTTPSWTAEGNQSGSYFGYGTGTAGDVNGDGYADLFVGAFFYDNGEVDEGRGYVYHGSVTGLSPSPNWTVEGNQTSARLGNSGGTAGDVNGDGYADVVVGAYGYDNGQVDEGRAYVYYGNSGDGLDLTPRQMRTDGSVHIAPLGMSDAPNAFQLRLTGRMPLGREDVKLQWQVAPLGTPFTATAVVSGTSAAWTDVLTTGVVISQNVTGLVPLTPYHWRVRLLYRPGNALGQPAGRWLTVPWDGWSEQDFRTPVCEPVTGADFTWMPVTPTVGQPVTFTGTATGTLPLAFSWAFGDGGSGSGPVVTHTYAAPGDYTVTLTVANDCGEQVLSYTLAVIPACAPVTGTAFTWTPVTPTLGQPVTFTGTATGTLPLAFSWAFGDGGSGSGSGPVVTHTYTAPGDYTVTLTVANDCGEQVVSHTLVVFCAPVTGTAFTWTPVTPTVGEEVTFTGTATGTPPLFFRWAFGDGGTAAGATVVHTYAVTGTYTVTMTVTNGCGWMETIHPVTVRPVPGTWILALPLVHKGDPLPYAGRQR
jgi:PKD repeat protein